jgi:hypothetical protein
LDSRGKRGAVRQLLPGERALAEKDHDEFGSASGEFWLIDVAFADKREMWH